MNHLSHLLEQTPCALVCVDAFDTLLLRKPVSLDRRLLKAARLFCKRLRQRDPSIELVPFAIARRRREIERLAYRARDVTARGEVRLENIASTLLEILRLDAAYFRDWIDCELAVERECLVPNMMLIRVLEQLQARGVPIRVVSDTALSAEALGQLIGDVCPPGLRWAGIHTSADMQLTKRDGTIFSAISSIAQVPLHQIAHLGDDPLADWTMPRQHGMTAIQLPRPRLHRAMRQADAAFARSRSLWHRWSVRAMHRPSPSHRLSPVDNSRRSEVLGPILAEYCRRMHMYLRQTAELEGSAIALFCARGGLGLQKLYEIYASQFPADSRISVQPLMISRLVAVRDAVVYGGEEVISEIEYEFGNGDVRSLARALSAADQSPAADYACVSDFIAALRAGREPHLYALVVEQAERFRIHWRRLTAGQQGVVICDTGLYGSTFKSLKQSGLALDVHCVQLARCDYKGLGRDHFAELTGLLTERNGYKPGDSISSILAFWHLIEGLLEPELESVRRFERMGEGTVVSNLETQGWQHKLTCMPNPAFDDVARYIARVASQPTADAYIADFERAAARLERMIMFPDAELVNQLAVQERSVDFGRDGTCTIADRNCDRGDVWKRLLAVRRSLWPSGAAVRAFPHSHRILQTTFRLGYTVRSWIR